MLHARGAKAALRKVSAGLVLGALVVGGTVFTTPAHATDAVQQPVRDQGDDRYGTAVAVSERAFPDPSTVHGVVIASGTAFADALSGGPLAAKVGGPVLLAASQGLTPDTTAELARFGKLDHVYVVGGPSVVSPAIVKQLSAYGPVTRLSGADRYATSLAVAKEVAAGTSVPAVFLADGRNFPDALSAGAPAAGSKSPIILMPGNWPATAAVKFVVARSGAKRAYAVGGSDVLSNGSTTVGIPVTRLAGANRYATNKAVDAAFPQGNKPVYLASGDNYPDALAAGAATAATGGSLLLSPPYTLAAPTRLALATHVGAPLVVVGGPDVVSKSVQAQAQAILNPGSGVEPGSNVSVFFTPHQDDETLTMGPAIIQEVRAGREVHIVDVTDGAASNAIVSVNAKLRQQRLPAITVAQFSAARNRELLAAAGRLGVPAQNITFEGMHDNGLALAQASAIIDKYMKKFPGAALRTISWLDINPDHSRMGVALDNRCTADETLDCEFFQADPYRLDIKTRINPNVPPVVTPQIISKTVISDVALTNALNEYKVWNPAAGRYAIGQTSVASWFAVAYKDRSSLAHMDSNHFRSQADINAAAQWMKQYRPN